MKISRQEEIIAVLYLIAALLAFNGDYCIAGYILMTKAAMDTVCAIYHSIKEVKAEVQP